MDGSDIIDATGYQTGILNTRQLFPFGYDAEITANDETITYDGRTIEGATNGYGYRMIRAGTCTGVSCQFDCTNSSTDADLTVTVYLNNVAQSMAATSANLSSVTDYGMQSTANSFTFTAGQQIKVRLALREGAANTCSVDDIAVLVEISA
ncbi:MAG: hypothetical protein ACW96U_01020, partial [Candidatus Heimdallarchaeaceae archaeon]|jgi:Fe-S cluster assembly iron-binding protein IscA